MEAAGASRGAVQVVSGLLGASRPLGPEGPGPPGLQQLLLPLSLALPPAVDGFGAGTQLPQPQGAQPQLQVLGDLAALGPDLLQPLDGRLGQGEVADGGVRLHPHAAVAHGGEVSLGPDDHLVLARVQEAPEVTVSS